MSERASIRLQRIWKANAMKKEEEEKSAGRVFITSYQKSGTHQIMPMFMTAIGNITDYSRAQFRTFPECYEGMPSEINQEHLERTCKQLRDLKGAVFGHLVYLPEFAKAVQHRLTKVLFNVRDPRDVVVAEYERIKHCYNIGTPMHAWLNHWSMWGGERHRLFEGSDPIMELIELAAARWPIWLGWLDHDWVMKVKYEELRLEPNETVTKIKAFILPYLSPAHHLMVERALPRGQGYNPTFRKGAVGEWKDYFEPRHVEAAESLMGDIFEKLEYEF